MDRLNPWPTLGDSEPHTTRFGVTTIPGVKATLGLPF